MISTILDEHEADKATIASLLRELVKRGNMSNLFKLADGTIIRAHSFEVVSQTELSGLATQLQTDLDLVNSLIAPAVEPEPVPQPVDQPSPSVEPVAAPIEQPQGVPVQAVEPAPAQPEAPAQPAPIQLQ